MLSAGTMLGGRYRLDERIAGGGMGDVWRGTDEVLGRTVAVKVLLPALLEEPGFAERFRGEARTMATINHPGVVDVYDYGSENGTAFLVMEYIEGDALSRTLSRVGRLTPARTMALVAQAADALHAAHDKGIVHRDVKPGNLLVRPNGTLVLTDFGIARSAMVGQLTAAGSVLGTASYISPEQAAGATATALSDVYALGVVAYQCLSGHRPFEGDNPLEIAMRHVRDAPPPLPGDIPPAVRQVVERAMAKDPGARWPSAAALAQVARRVAGQLSAAPVSGAPGSGAPVSGGGAVPVSGAPGPVSGGPASAGSGPAGPAPHNLAPLGAAGAAAAAAGPRPPVGPVAPGVGGGTRVMPPGGYPPTGPVSPGAPLAAGGMVPRVAPGSAASGPVPTGQYVRGAAAVPAAPAPGGDTGYTYAGPTGYPPAAPPTSRGGRRNGLVLLAVFLGVLLLALCAGGGYLLLAGKGDGGGGTGNQAATATGSPTPAATSAAPSASAAATGPLHTLNCQAAVNREAGVVKRALEKDHYPVKIVKVPGRPEGRVAQMSPCGTQPEGTEVTLRVFDGTSGPAPSVSTSCNPFDPAGLASCFPR
jgi:eukaryotic-like serine/threonine-protein kinase